MPPKQKYDAIPAHGNSNASKLARIQQNTAIPSYWNDWGADDDAALEEVVNSTQAQRDDESENLELYGSVKVVRIRYYNSIVTTDEEISIRREPHNLVG